VQRHIISGFENKNFSYLLNEYKAARKVRNAAAAAGRAAGGGGRRGRGPKPAKFDPNAEDRDADGKVQDGTPFERPATPSTPDVSGKPAASGAAPKSTRRRLSGEALTESFNNMADEPENRRQRRRRLAQQKEPQGRQGKPSRRGVPVFTPLKRDDNKKRAERDAELRKQGGRPTIYGQSLLEDFSEEQQRYMLDKFYKINPIAKMSTKDAKNQAEEIEMLMAWMVKNQEEAAIQAGMLDNGKLTLRAQIAQKWYDVANKFNTSIADKYGIKPEAVHATMAIFSARTAWPVNVAGGMHAVDLMAKNPTLTISDFKRMRSERVTTLNQKIKDDTKKLAKAKEIIADAANQTPEVLQKAKRDERDATERMKKSTKELGDIEKWSINKWVDSIGGKVNTPLREQNPKVGGRFIKANSSIALNKGPIRAIEFDIDPQGNYTPIVTNKSAVMAHDPEDKQAKIFEVLQAAFDGDEEKMLELIDKNLGDGAKVRSFYNNMSDPNEADFASITGDTHHAGVSLAIPGNNSEPWFKTAIFSPSDVDNRTVGGPFGYMLLKEATERFAERYGILPREAQSILWEAQRLLWNIDESLKPEAVKRIKKFAKGSNATPDSIREYMWEVHKELYAGVVGKTSAPYKGDTTGYLP
jgi:hypothetical protein